jgi:hypothetical protein
MPTLAHASAPPRISATILKDFDACETYWAFKHKDKRSTPTNEDQQFGIDGHEQRERFLRDGRSPDLSTQAGRAALAGVKHLPHPRTAELSVERYFKVQAEGILWVGKVDFDHPDPERERVWVVGDHKFTGTFDWLADLATDEQRVLYAWEASRQRDLDTVLTRWIYTLRNKPHTTQPVEYEEARGLILERFHDDLVPRARRIGLALLEPTEARSKNFNHCGAYRGCPFVPICHATATPAEKMRAAMGKENLLRRLKGGASDAPPSPTPGRDPAIDRAKYDEAAPPTSGQPAAKTTSSRLGRLKGATQPPGTSTEDVDQLVEVKTPVVPIAVVPAISSPEAANAVEPEPEATKPARRRGPGRPPKSDVERLAGEVANALLDAADSDRGVRLVLHAIGMWREVPLELVEKHVNAVLGRELAK